VVHLSGNKYSDSTALSSEIAADCQFGEQLPQ
jgi:hypothetical protein